MLVDFNQLPGTSRIWIYQSDTKFSEDQIQIITSSLEQFLVQWIAHGQDLKAGFEVKYNRFIIIALDQNVTAASGCSIDAQVRFIQQLQSQFEVDLLDKMNVTYYQNDRIHYKTLADFKQMAKDGAIGKKTVVFNNLVTNLQEYQEHWEVPAIESWHSRFLKK